MITSSFYKNTLAGLALGLTVASLHALPEIDAKELALVSQIRVKILAAKKDAPAPLAASSPSSDGRSGSSVGSSSPAAAAALAATNFFPPRWRRTASGWPLMTWHVSPQ